MPRAARPDADAPRRRLRLRHQAQHPAPARRAGLRRDAWCPRRRPPTRCSRSSPTGSSSRTARAIPAAVAGRCASTCASSPDKYPMFGICLGHQILGLALGGDDVQAQVRPPRRQPARPGPRHAARSRSAPRTTATPSTPTRCARPASRSSITHVNLNDGTVEGLAHETRPLFSVQYHPRRRRARTTPATSSGASARWSTRHVAGETRHRRADRREGASADAAPRPTSGRSS